MSKMTLLGKNTKINKSDVAGQGYVTMALQLAPSDSSGVNVCPWSGACAKPCVGVQGFNAMPIQRQAKINRTRYFFEQPEAFKTQLIKEIASANKSAKRKGMKLAVRLNTYSDILWEKRFPELFQLFPDVQFYDYTKAPYNIRPNEALPSNYRLTYSFSERSTEQDVKLCLAHGRNVAMVFEALPLGVYDGDSTDLRFLDPKGIIVGLRFKGSKAELQDAIARGFCKAA